MSSSSSCWKDFFSADIEEVEQVVSSMVKSHRLDQQSLSHMLRARIRYAEFKRFSLIRLGYGADVQIRPDFLDDFYLIQIPQYGRADVRINGELIESTPKIASLLNPHVEVDMLWYSNNEQLMLKIDRQLVESKAEALGFIVPKTGLVFNSRMDNHHNSRWKIMQRYLIDCARNLTAFEGSPILLSQLEELLVTTLFEIHPPLAEQSYSKRDKLLPRYLLMVEDYLQAHAEEAISLEKLAALAKVSVRTLQAGFRDYRGISPMQYLRQIRLDRAHQELLEGVCDQMSVSEVALKWGFNHQGRFSAAFKQRFGQSPSQLLRRS